MRHLALVLLLLVAAPLRAEDAPRHRRAQPGFSGEACAEMALERLGSSLDADDVFELSGVDPAKGRGLEPRELASTLEKIGFVKPLAEAKTTEDAWRDLRADLARGVVSAVLLREGQRLVFEATDDEVFFHDPDSADGARCKMKRAAFLEALREPLRVRFEKGGTLASRPERGAHSAADFARHCRDLVKKLPGPWPIVIEKPFVVTGDDPQVKAHARDTVRWAVSRLKRDFFSKDPDAIIDVWLFDGKESYEKHTKALFDETPTTPFGYYSPRLEALIMNIATGSGTLVHEIVHPFVHSNFRACPAWLNEGMGSLFEQCGDKDGHIHGFTNWRLKGLKAAIEKGPLPGFEKLTGTTSIEFYGEDRGTNYAQARYLCYYLQEKGLLVDFWKRFLKDQGDDPTGYKSLVATLGEKDMTDFQKRWEKWALGLRFP